MFWKWRKEKIHAYVVVLNKQCLPSSGIYDIMIVVLGCRQAVKAQDFDSCIRGFESRQPSNANEPETFDLLRFPAHSLCIGEA